MKVVYIAASEYPSTAANSVQVVKQCNGFSSTGASVLLLAREGKAFVGSTLDIAREYNLDRKVMMKLLRTKHLPCKLGSLLFPFWAAFYVPAETEVIYARHILGLTVAALLRRKIRTVYECHGPPGFLGSLALRILCRTCRLDRVVVISGALERILQGEFPYLKDVDILVAHDGCDLVEQKREVLEFSVGYVGSFYRGRGLDLIAELAMRFPSVSFHLVGGTEEVFHRFAGKEPPNNVICHGRISPSKLQDFFNLFSVALAPYARQIEVADGTNTVDYMSPLKIFEYMGYGKAVIASDLPVLREVLKDGVNALLVTPESTKSWADALLRMQDARFRKKLATNAEADARCNHSWESRARKVLSF